VSDDWPSLRDPDLAAFWDRVRDRVERTDGPLTGRLAVPDLTASARLTLASLIGRPPGRTMDLTVLEEALRRLAVGPTLREVLVVLGHPASDERADRRADRRAADLARRAARHEAAKWPEEWRGEWIEAIVRAGALRGLDETDATAFVGDVRRVLDELDRATSDTGARPRSRVDLAAELFGNSHALDTGTRMEAAISRALGCRHQSGLRREVWDLAGVHLDLTSAPVLVWNLNPVETCELRPLVVHATELGVPIHLSQFALRQPPVMVVPGTVVLVVENPRLVEAAAQRRSALTVVATNGNPSTAVRVLLSQLLACGAHVRAHADFDAAGLAICGRLAAMGLKPWRMTSTDYVAAVAAADAQGVELPLDATLPPPTPWDATLHDAFASARRVVHEERLIEDLLG
jgi:uncharacterized protein (TIGR02679 family)